MGMLIVVEGLDGSGKATQAKRLADALRAEGRDVMQITFPRYENDSSALVKQYLAGEFGQRPEDVNPYAASTFYTVDRYASFRTLWGTFYADGGVVVADRYTTSNAVHQCSKLPRENWDEFLGWLFDFEYGKVAIPAPDLVLYLDVDVAVSQSLLAHRYHGDEAKKDIHENSPGYLEHSREAALYCARKNGWEVISCCREGEMRPIDDIHGEIYTRVNAFLQESKK